MACLVTEYTKKDITESITRRQLYPIIPFFLKTIFLFLTFTKFMLLSMLSVPVLQDFSTKLE
jgi:hypothetical protein